MTRDLMNRPVADRLDSASRPEASAASADNHHDRPTALGVFLAPPPPQRHRLRFKFVPLYLSGAALLVAAHLGGWVGSILEADDTGRTPAIFGVFVGGVAIYVR